MKYLILLSFTSYLFGAATSEQEIKLLSDTGAYVGRVNPDLDEQLTKKSFQEIIQNNSKNGSGTLLARVQTKDGAARIYDASAFNQKLFGTFKPDVATQDVADPLSQQPIVDIRYFLLRSPDEHDAFNVGSIAGMKSSPSRAKFVQALFDANDSAISFKERIPLFILIGNHYAQGVGVRSKDERQAMYWYNKASNQEIDKRSQAKADYHIGVLYGNGSEMIPKNLVLARSFLEKAVNQDASVGSKEFGLYELAHIDEQEGYLFKAKVTLDFLARAATLSEVRKLAGERIAEIARKIEMLGHNGDMYGKKPEATPAQIPYQLQRDKKMQIYVDPATSSGDRLLRDQNTPPRKDLNEL